MTQDKSRAPLVIALGVVAIVAVGGLMVRRAEMRTNKIALASKPQPVGVVVANASTYRASRTFGGSFQSWTKANVGPQRVAAYVDSVIVRPGEKVKKGDVLGALDCRNASTLSKAAAMRARAVETRQKAVANEVDRLQKLTAGHFVSENEVELALSTSAAEQASLEMERANIVAMGVVVDDCILRAPFDGEVSDRFMDPGWFARPGTAVVEVIDRSVVRLVADAPETDFELLPQGARVRVTVLSTGHDVEGTISRRTPSTDRDTRTLRFEVDVPDADMSIPANTSGEVHIDVGASVPATELPLHAASISGDKAILFVADGNVARRVTVAVKGEIGGSLYVDPSFAAGSRVIVSGRALLQDGDPIEAGGS